MTPRLDTLAALAAAAALLAGWPPSPAAADGGALVLERTIPLGAVSGRIDHFAVDLGRQRLFVAELGNGTVGVLDLVQGKVIHRLAGLKEPQGIGYEPGSDTVYVANGGDGTVRRYRAADFAALDTLDLGEDADNVRIDASAGQVLVGYGRGALAVLEAASGKRIADIRLAAHPESFRLDPTGGRVYVNVPDARQVAVVDRTGGGQVAAWMPGGLGGNFPMALDDGAGQLAVIYRKPATLVVFGTRRGDVVARLPTCGDADDVFFDTRRRRIYVSCGDGMIDVVQKEGDAYRDLGRIPTVPGARTSLWVPELDRLFLGVRASGREPAAVWVYRPAP